MYKSPIEIFKEEMQYYFDNNIVEAVQRYDIQVDKDELLKALRYDRDQYEKGYADGLNACPWISVENDHKPRHLEDCFIAYVFGENGMTFFGEARYYAFGGNGFVDRPHFRNEGVDGMRVTHWMSVPKLEKREENK